MYLEITFKDGSTNITPVSASHTLQVISPGDATIQAAWALNDVIGVGLADGLVVTPEHAPPPDLTGAAEGPTVTDVEPTTSTNAESTVNVSSAPDGTTVNGEPVVPSDPTSDPSPSSDGSTTPETTGSTPSTDSPAADPQGAHDQAVADATDAIELAQDPAAPVDEKTQLVEEAQGDVETALAQWPDSPALQDAKAKLEQLAAELAGAK